MVNYEIYNLIIFLILSVKIPLLADSEKRYNQIISGMQLGYKINNDHYIFISGGVKYPNKDPGVVVLTNLNTGYTVNLNDNLQMTLNVTRGLACIDKAWLFNIGFNYRFK